MNILKKGDDNMKVTKPKENQVLLEDDIFRQFDLNVESKTGLVDSEFNESYECLILSYRLPNMEASKQIFYGDIVGINTIITSMLKNLIDKKIIDLEYINHLIKESKKNEIYK